MSARWRMPAEWAKHKCCWMLWPYRGDNWYSNAKPAQHAFVNVARAISQFEPVKMGVLEEHMESARKAFDGIETIHPISLVPMIYDDAWMRDVGPTFVFSDEEDTKGNLVGMDWLFNAWGEKTSTWEQDKLVAKQVLEVEHVLRVPADFILEGGSIHVDGEGTLLTTEECLLNRNRNPSLTKEEIENRLKHHLGVSKIIWLPDGLAFDEDTDGHIDNMCCFSKPGEVLLCWTDNESDPNYARCRSALEVLERECDAQQRKIAVIKLPIPTPMYYSQEELSSLSSKNGELNRMEGVRLAGSYVNFYIANSGIVCPSFNCPEDEIAQQILRDVFPARQVVAVPGRDILLGGGNIHCITQQQPDV